MGAPGATREEVFQFIRDYREEHRMPPTRREIAKGVGIGLSTAQYHIDSLEAEGLIRRIKGISRGIVESED